MFSLMASPSAGTGLDSSVSRKDTMVGVKCSLCTFTTEGVDAQVGVEMLKIHALSHHPSPTPAPPPQLLLQSRTDVGMQHETLESQQQMSLLITLVLAGAGWMLVMYGVLTRHWAEIAYPSLTTTHMPHMISTRYMISKRYPTSLGVDPFENFLLSKILSMSLSVIDGLFTCYHYEWTKNLAFTETTTPKSIVISEECYFYNKFVQALIILGILAASAAILLLGVSVVVLRGKSQVVTILGGVACLSGGMLVIMGTIVYGGVKYTTASIQWSLALAAAGGFVLFVAGALALVKGRAVQPGKSAVFTA